jgi:hypothetical protein
MVLSTSNIFLENSIVTVMIIQNWFGYGIDMMRQARYTLAILNQQINEK